eukprot:gene14428-13170_t
MPPAPAKRLIDDSADALIGALEGLIAAIDARDFDAARKVGVVDFMMSLPSRLENIIPGTAEWLTDNQITTTDVQTIFKGQSLPLLQSPWTFRASGLLVMLRDVLQRNIDQLRAAQQGGWWSRDDKHLLPEDVDTIDLLRAQKVLLTDLQTADAVEAMTFKKDPQIEEQIFKVWNRALREYGDPKWEPEPPKEILQQHAHVVDLFGRMSWRLHHVLRNIARPALVFRGIDVRVSRNYTPGTVLPWCSQTSSSYASLEAEKFAGVAGTWFACQGLSGAPIAWGSPFPGERELLFP